MDIKYISNSLDYCGRLRKFLLPYMLADSEPPVFDTYYEGRGSVRITIPMIDKTFEMENDVHKLVEKIILYENDLCDRMVSMIFDNNKDKILLWDRKDYWENKQKLDMENKCIMTSYTDEFNMRPTELKVEDDIPFVYIMRSPRDSMYTYRIFCLAQDFQIDDTKKILSYRFGTYANIQNIFKVVFK